MAEKTVAEKMRLKPGMIAAALYAPEGVVGALDASGIATWTDDASGADAVLLFASTQADVEERVTALLPVLTSSTMIWICYPKGSKTAGHDVSRDTIWPFVESLGMRPVGMVSIDETWSGFRLRISS